MAACTASVGLEVRGWPCPGPRWSHEGHRDARCPLDVVVETQLLLFRSLSSHVSLEKQTKGAFQFGFFFLFFCLLSFVGPTATSHACHAGGQGAGGCHPASGPGIKPGLCGTIRLAGPCAQSRGSWQGRRGSSVLVGGLAVRTHHSGALRLHSSGRKPGNGSLPWTTRSPLSWTCWMPVGAVGDGTPRWRPGWPASWSAGYRHSHTRGPPR